MVAGKQRVAKRKAEMPAQMARSVDCTQGPVGAVDTFAVGQGQIGDKAVIEALR